MITACGALIENGFQNGFSLFFLHPLTPWLRSPSPPTTAALSLAEGDNIGRTVGGRGRERGRGREGGREGRRGGGSRSSLSPCHGRDSRAIRLINGIIDHLMGLIINCFGHCPGPAPFLLLPLYAALSSLHSAEKMNYSRHCLSELRDLLEVFAP